MATKMNLWSLTLLPGEKYPMYIRRDFVLTNAALGEDLRSNDGRSVVKVTHQPSPPHFGDDSDSEFDSDLDIDDDEELDEDEFELDEEEGFKLTPKKGKAEANGEAMDEDDDEEEEDDDEEDEDDEDFSDDEEVEETNVICSLTAGKTEQTSLDLTFVAGDAVMFEVTGENAVHLLGNYIYQPGAEDSDDESDFDDEHDDYSDLELDSEDEDFDEEEAPAGKITEITEPAPKAAAKPKAAPAATENKKRKADAIESPAPKAAAAEESTEGLSKAQKKKLAKKTKRESEGAAPAAAASPAQEKKPEAKKESKIKKLPNGLIIEDVTVGDGPIAKTGKRLGMRYIGKLENGKQFDANTSGKAFTFVLGRGEVIKGWDQGLVGMHVGGERRSTIPAPLAYGNQKLPGIPKGSTLKFDVKLVSVN